MSKLHEAVPKSPTHVLMDPSVTTLALDDRMRRDYLSQRFQAYQRARPPKNNSEIPADEAFWCGATSVERSLVQCCESSRGVADDDGVVPGALAKDKVLRFVGLVAAHCHTLVTRSIALNILERGLKADEKDPPIPVEPKDESPETAAKTTRTTRLAASHSASPEAVASADEHAVTLPSIPTWMEYARITSFLEAGGLRLLSQWLVDCTTPGPTPPPVKPPPGSKPPTRKEPAPPVYSKPSATSPLLLPLLIFLRRIPFNRQAVTESKINKHIRRISKTVNTIVKQAQDRSTSSRKPPIAQVTDILTGPTPIVEVQAALNELKETWEAKSQAATAFAIPLDPFAALRAQIQERVSQVAQFEKGEISRPHWWTNEPTGAPAKKRPRISTEQMARKERENEKAALMRESLKQAAAERAKLLKKLRELKHKQSEGMAHESKHLMRRRVQWKDAMGPTSLQRNRAVLEEVFIFTKDKIESKESSATAMPAEAAESSSVETPTETETSDIFE